MPQRSARTRGRHHAERRTRSLTHRGAGPSRGRSPVRRFPQLALAGLAWAAACGDGATEPPPPELPRATTVTVTPATAQLVALGATVQLSAQVLDQNGQVMADAVMTWESSDDAVATVDGSGLVTATGNGTATVTATAGEASGSAVVTVAQSSDSVAVVPTEATIAALGDTLRLDAEAFDVNGHAVADAEFSWESSDDAVATVDGSGLVTATGNGTATVTATAGEASGSAVVTVAQSPDSVAVVPAEATIAALGDALRLEAEAFDANGHAVAAAEFSWESSDDAVATVDGSGLVTARGNGTATVTATAGEASGSAVVTVAQSPDSVAVVPAEATIAALGDALRLEAEAFDANGHAVADAEFSWESSDDAVATVDGSGLVTARGNGTATVTATAGEASGSAVVTVAQSPESVAVVPAEATIAALGDTLRLEAEAFDANGHAVAGAEFSWESSDDAVATVDGSGLVTARGNGTATVTATAGEASGSAVVTVAQSPDSVDVVPVESTIAALGDTLRLDAEAFDANGHAVAGAEFSWESSDDAVATVDGSGLVTARGNGTATVTASAESVSGMAAVTVIQVLDSVALLPTEETITALGDTLRLAAEAFDVNGHAVAEVEFSWESSDDAVATVDGSGLVTATGNGTATVTATAGEASGSAVVTVAQSPESVAVVPAEATIAALGDTLRLDAEAFDANGHAVAGAEFSWESSDDAVATVDGSGLVTARGNGTATVTASAVSVSGMAAVTVIQVLDSVALLPPEETITALGDTLRLAAEAFDANGHAVAGAEFSWESSDDAVATVDGSGLVTATGNGTATVTATAGEASGSAVVTVAKSHALEITGSEPATMVEGGSATIRGWGFSFVPAQNAVSVGGLAAAVTSATDTTLTIQVPRSDCLPPRGSQLQVALVNEIDTLTVGVTPRTREDLDLPQHHFRYTRPGNGCLHLPGNVSGGEYLIGVTSISEDPSSLTAITLHGTPGDPSVVSAASYVARIPASLAGLEGTGTLGSSPVLPRAVDPQIHFGELQNATDTLLRRNAHAHSDLMARNLDLVRRLGRTTAPDRGRRASRAVRSLQVGDTLVVYADVRRTCTTSEEVTALVRLVGEHSIWLEDIDNPGDRFTDAELADLDAFYTSSAKMVHDSYFGSLSDVDNNDAVLVLMTKQVNRIEYVGGWVWFGDLYSKQTCPTSNHAEIFYVMVPDPAGSVGRRVTKQQLLGYYPRLLTHEVTHLVQANARAFGSAGHNTLWEIEGGATLAEQLVAYRVFGHESGQNLGWSDYRRGANWYWGAWVADLANFFGWDSDNNGRVENAPEQCSWVGYPREGNDGPCKRPFAAVYGVPAMVLRLVMDTWGTSYPGGESALMKRLTQSPERGFASLEDVSSVRIEEILTHFYIALWADGREYDGVTFDVMKSWNLYDIMSHLHADLQLMPYATSSAEPGVTARIRAGSSVYLHWTPSGALGPTSIRVTAPNGGAADNIFVWGLRLR